MKLGIDVNRNMTKRFNFACIFVAVMYLANNCATYYLIQSVTDPKLAIPYAISYSSSSFYSTFFVVGFCFMLFAVYRRYAFINFCIRFENSRALSQGTTLDILILFFSGQTLKLKMKIQLRSSTKSQRLLKSLSSSLLIYTTL